jgi:hypothetical protein
VHFFTLQFTNPVEQLTVFMLSGVDPMQFLR